VPIDPLTIDPGIGNDLVKHIIEGQEYVLATVAAVCAVVQVVFAGWANYVALKIARDQAAEAKRARDEAAEAKREALRHYIETVMQLGSLALNFTGHSLSSWQETSARNIPSNWIQRLIEYRGALDSIRGASPPDAKLLIAVTRLGRALDYPIEHPPGVGFVTVDQVMKQVQGSISEELNHIESLAIHAGCEVGPEQDERMAASLGVFAP
jgi:hypothetical protein